MTSDHDYGDIGQHYADYTAMHNRAERYRGDYEFFQAQAESFLKRAELLGSSALAEPDEIIPPDSDTYIHRYHGIKLAGLICKARALDAEIDLHNLKNTITQHTKEANTHYKTHEEEYYHAALNLAQQSGKTIVTRV